MRIAGALLSVVLITGCTGSGGTASVSPTATSTIGPSPAATSAPSPSQAGLWAVMVHRAGEGEPYFVQLVGPDGRGGPWVEPVTRSAKMFYFPPTACPPGAMCAGAETANYTLPETSVSASQVYFLDADTVIRSLAPGGTVAVVKTIHAPPNSQVAFSVSPDDRRMAISIITLATDQSVQPVDVHMYVEDVVGGSNRVDLYSSTTLAEWPIGWHAGNLVVAIGSQDIGTYDNAYAATRYQVVDPATGHLVTNLDCARGLLVRAGTACADGWCATGSGPCTAGTIGRQAWDGLKTLFRLPSGPPPRILAAFANEAELSPDGSRIAAEVVEDAPTFAVDTAVFADGVVTTVAQNKAPLGWLDDTHLIVSSPDQVEIIDMSDGHATPMSGLRTIPQQGMPVLAGILPADLG